MAAYQCFPETVRLFKSILRTDPHAKFFALTPQIEEAKAIAACLPPTATMFLCAAFCKVNAYLNAADFAFMLRERSPINTAASPTKFAEYGLTGLPVIMKDAVPDSYALAKTIGNLRAYEDGRPAPALEIDRSAVMQRYRAHLSRSAFLDGFQRLYSSPSRADG